MALVSLKQYRLLATLGRGGMCEVTLAAKGTEAVDFTKLVVIKMPRPEFVDDEEFVTMFLDEARIAARLNHPNVVQTLDVGQEGKHYFLALEYLDGQPLSAIFRAQMRKMPLGMKLSILCDVLAGIHYAHELKDYDGCPLNIVHRDVTPHNVFVTYDGQVKVMDFGIAKAAGRAAETQQGVIKGKVGYLAPEQVLGDAIDRRADVFNIGVMLYEACVEQRMWPKETSSSEVLGAVMNGAYPRSPRERNPKIHEALDSICRKALAFDPKDRHATALEFQEELEAYITEHERRPSARQLGAFVATCFAAEREMAQKIIQAELRENGVGHIEVEDSTSQPLAAASASKAPTALLTSEEAPTLTAWPLPAWLLPWRTASGRIWWLALLAVMALALGGASAWWLFLSAR
jgi:serine/threonine-protein kinase